MVTGRDIDAVMAGARHAFDTDIELNRIQRLCVNKVLSLMENYLRGKLYANR